MGMLEQKRTSDRLVTRDGVVESVSVAGLAAHEEINA